MYPKSFLISLCLLLGASGLQGQDLPRTVVGSSGDYYDNLLFGSLHFTVGEIAVAQYENEIQLGEGFHRVYYDLIVDVETILPTNWEVNIYPNPTIGQVNIQLPTEVEARATLFNSSGQLIKQAEGIINDSTIDFSNLPAGTYQLHLRDKNGQHGTFQILKLNY